MPKYPLKKVLEAAKALLELREKSWVTESPDSGESQFDSCEMHGMHGMTIEKKFVDEHGILRPYRGRVKYLGSREKPYCFKVTYEDGDVETMTFLQVTKLIRKR